jgi:arylsulfatase A-like enzyme
MKTTRAIFKANGTRYKNAVATTPLCCPARASIYSGQYAHNHGVHNNGQAEAFNPDTSMQAILRDSGYKTAYSGKYLNLEPIDPEHFDYWSIMRGGKLYYNIDMNVNGVRRSIEDYSTDFIGKKAVHFIERFEEDDADPWFLFVSPNAPHLPAQPEPKYEDDSVPPWLSNPAIRENTPTKLRDKPDHVLDQQKGQRKAMRIRKLRLQTLMSVDDMVAKIFRRLGEEGELDNTLAFLLSDNGFLLGEHGLMSKRYPYDMSVGIPLYVWWPGHVSPGAVEKRLVGNIDIAPTVYEATGTEPNYQVDGKSLFNPEKRNRILLESWSDARGPAVPTWKGLWSPEYKYVEYETGELEYYDNEDKWELINRLGNKSTNDDPENAPILRAWLQADSICSGPTCP